MYAGKDAFIVVCMYVCMYVYITLFSVSHDGIVIVYAKLKSTTPASWEKLLPTHGTGVSKLKPRSVCMLYLFEYRNEYRIYIPSP